MACMTIYAFRHTSLLSPSEYSLRNDIKAEEHSNLLDYSIAAYMQLSFALNLSPPSLQPLFVGHGVDVSV